MIEKETVINRINMKTEATGSLVTINVDGKPLEKLIEVVSNGIGTLYRPRKIKKEADAQAYAIKVLEKAKAEAGAESLMIETETAERISQRIVAKEMRRQDNIDTVVEMAADNLAGVEVSDKPVDEDWASRFFDIVQDVSREEMKTLWAKILAKEIEKPSSYSLRTLEVLRNISFEEAELFMKIADFVFKQRGCMIFAENGELDKYGIKYNDLAKLREAGLVQSGEMISRTYMSSKTGIVHSNLLYGDLFVQMTIQPQTPNLVLPILLLTQAGCEIYELVKPKQNHSYLKDFASFIKKKNPTARVQYSNVLGLQGTQIEYALPLRDV